MNQPTELAALRQKLSAIESEIDAGRRAMIGIETHNGALAGLRSDCLKAISRLTLAKIETHNGALAGLRSDCLKAISRLTLAKPEPAPLQDNPPAK